MDNLLNFLKEMMFSQVHDEKESALQLLYGTGIKVQLKDTGFDLAGLIPELILYAKNGNSQDKVYVCKVISAILSHETDDKVMKTLQEIKDSLDSIVSLLLLNSGATVEQPEQETGKQKQKEQESPPSRLKDIFRG
jgi:hypothetical protein